MPEYASDGVPGVDVNVDQCSTPLKCSDDQDGREEQDNGTLGMDVETGTLDELLALYPNNTIQNLQDFIQLLSHDYLNHFTGRLNLYDGNVDHGLFMRGHTYLQINRGGKDDYQLIFVNRESKEMAVWSASTIHDPIKEENLMRRKENGVVDLDNTGCYWEGEVLYINDHRCIPYGYGKEYNEENDVVYEGFVVEGKRVCYGKEYRGICNTKDRKNGLVYEGGYVNGNRYGVGRSYELNGKMNYQGDWVDNQYAGNMLKKKEVIKTKEQTDLLVLTSLEELAIKDGLQYYTTISSLHFSPFLSRLKRIEISNTYFTQIRELVLDGLRALESVKIENDICRDVENERIGGRFCIKNCPKLCTFEIDDSSFKEFDRFELSNINSLQSIDIGNFCFQYVSTFVVEGLENLEMVKIGSGSFPNYCQNGEVGICRIVNCPKLRHLETGKGCFSAFKIFEIANVNSLQSIKMGGNCFQSSNAFVLDGLEKLESVRIGPFSFTCKHKVQEENSLRHFCITNCPNLQKLEIDCDSFKEYNQLKLSNVNALQYVRISHNCFQRVSKFGLDGLEGLGSLETLKIGLRCFIQNSNYNDNHHNDNEDNDESFYITNCPKLRLIWIGFGYYDDSESKTSNCKTSSEHGKTDSVRSKNIHTCIFKSNDFIQMIMIN